MIGVWSFSTISWPREPGCEATRVVRGQHQARSPDQQSARAEASREVVTVSEQTSESGRSDEARWITTRVARCLQPTNC